MNEQNNGNLNPTPVGGGQTPVQPVNPQSVQQQTPVQPTQLSPQTTPVAPTQSQSTPVESVPTSIPVQQPVVENHATPVEQNVAPMQPAQPVTQEPVQQPTPAPQQVQTPAPAPVESTPVSESVQNVATPVQQAPQQQPVQDITPAQPVTPAPVNSSVPNNGVFGPSVPLTGVNNLTDVGFVAASTDMPKKKNKGLIIGIIIAVIIVLAALGYFVIYPYVMKTYFSDPKNVYETSIKTAFKGLGTTANDLVHNKAIYDVEVTFDSNIDSLKDFTGYTYGINLGVDPDKKRVQEGFRVKKISDEVASSYNYYVKDNKVYENYSTSANRGYIYRGEVTPEEANDLFALFSNEDLYNTSSKLNSEDVNYLVDKISQLLVDSIDEEKLSKEDSSITIDGKTIKVTDNKYEIDYESLRKTVDFVIDGLIKDDKTVEILNKSFEELEVDAKEVLEAFRLEEDKEAKGTITTSIYTYGNKNEIVGFGLKNSDDEIDVHYYFNENYKELIANIKTKNPDTGKIEENSFEAVAQKEGDKTKVSCKYNDKEVATFEIRQWDEKGIDFNYSIAVDSDKINGTFKFTKDINDERAKISLEASVKMGSEYINVIVDISEDWTAEVANINTDTAIQIDDAELEKVQQDFVKAVLESPIGKIFTSTSGGYDPDIKDYYDSKNEIDSEYDIDDDSDINNDTGLNEEKDLNDSM